jgi:hypothetical protein
MGNVGVDKKIMMWFNFGTEKMLMEHMKTYTTFKLSAVD